MKRHIAGIQAANREPVPDGVFLVRVQRMQFRNQGSKPYYTLALSVLEPRRFSGQAFSSRIYCNSRALWKLSWFLRDFGYDAELLDRDEVDERQIIGLRGIVKISHVVYDGIPLVRFDGFAPASRWEELSPANLDSTQSAS